MADEPPIDGEIDGELVHPSGKRCVSPLNGADASAFMWKPGVKAGPGRAKGLRARMREYMAEPAEDGRPRLDGFVESLDGNARAGNRAAITSTVKLLDEEDIPTEIKIVFVDATERTSAT